MLHLFFIMVINILSTSTLPFTQRIERLYGELSPNGRKLADHLLHNSQDIITCTVAELATITQTSKATVSRFFRQLGYDSHFDVKREMNELRASGYPISTYSSDITGYKAELNRLKQTFDNIDNQQLLQFIDDIVQAKRITLIGFRNSYPVALHFRQQLLQIKTGVRVLPYPGQSISEDLEDIAADELIIFIGFRRRPRIFASLLKQFSHHKVALFADPSGQVYKDNTHYLFICQLGQEQALDSYAAPMSLISVICNKVLSTQTSQGQKRIANISARFSLLDELE
jgi:DNA-binding MurR/RpiR family transcriptional regulator